jgi:hypothetical protein
MSDGKSDLGKSKPRKTSARRNQDGGSQPRKGSFKETVRDISTPCTNTKEDDLDFQTTQKNMTDIITCKICCENFSDEDDKLLECERCENWECLDCSGLGSEQYTLIANIGPHIHWFCQECKVPAMKDVKSGKDIEEKCQQYMSKFREEIREEIKDEVKAVRNNLEKKISSEVNQVNKRIDDITLKASQKDQELKSIRQELQSVREEVEVTSVSRSEEKNHKEQELKSIQQELHYVREEVKVNSVGGIAEKNLKEMELREVKKWNLVLFNVEESRAITKEDVNKEDKEILEKIQQVLKTSATFSDITRLGARSPENVRPLKVTVSSTSEHRDILKAAKTLKGHTVFNKVYISRDMTPLERDSWRKLVKERKEKQEESDDKEENVRWVIYKGQVVKGRAPGPPEEKKE